MTNNTIYGVNIVVVYVYAPPGSSYGTVLLLIPMYRSCGVIVGWSVVVCSTRLLEEHKVLRVTTHRCPDPSVFPTPPTPPWR